MLHKIKAGPICLSIHYPYSIYGVTAGEPELFSLSWNIFTFQPGVKLGIKVKRVKLATFRP